jgi:Tol biopolymer transport system component
VSGDQGAGDIVLGDTNFAQDVFVADLLIPAGIVTVRVSIEHASDPDGDGDPDRNANGNSSNPDISDDGRYIVFDSSANDLVVADFGTFIDDVFAFDREFFIMTRVSVSTTGTPGNQGSFNPTISGDGLVVAFQSQADNLDSNPDTNNQQDIFIKSWLLPTPTTERVSLPDDSLLPLVTEGDGFCFNPSISRDGRFVAFSTNAKNLIAGDNNDTSDIYVRDRALGTTTRASVSFQGTEALEGAFQGSISADGRFVVFDSFSPNLVLGDTNNAGDVFVRDTVSGTTVRASVATYGVETSPFFSSFGGSISGDGRFVSFESSAANLTANDTNGVSDIFIRGPLY